jgi:hypothetical protein
MASLTPANGLCVCYPSSICSSPQPLCSLSQPLCSLTCRICSLSYPRRRVSTADEGKRHGPPIKSGVTNLSFWATNSDIGRHIRASGDTYGLRATHTGFGRHIRASGDKPGRLAQSTCVIPAHAGIHGRRRQKTWTPDQVGGDKYSTWGWQIFKPEETNIRAGRAGQHSCRGRQLSNPGKGQTADEHLGI